MEWERIAEDDETKGDEREEDSYGNPFRLPPADVIRSTYQTKHIDYGSAHPSVEGKKRSVCLAPPFPLLWLLLGSIALVRFGAPTSTKPTMNAPEQKKHHSAPAPAAPHATVTPAPTFAPTPAARRLDASDDPRTDDQYDDRYYTYEPTKRERHQERRRLYFFGWIALGLAGAAVLVVCLLNLGKLMRRDPSKPSKPVTEAEPLMRGATEYEACAAVPARRMNSEEMLAEEEAFVREDRQSPTLFTL